MTDKQVIKPHPFIADTRGHADYYGRFSCLWCPLPKANKVHDMVAAVDGGREIDQRKLGEGDE